MSIKSEFGEQLEAYFSGDMKGADRLVFEGRVESDPMLKAEFENQQDIIESLKAHRVAELKTRLAGINVEPTLIGSILQNTLFKPIVYGVASLAVVTGSYIFYNTGEAIEYHLEYLEGKRDYLTASNLEVNKNQSLNFRYKQQSLPLGSDVAEIDRKFENSASANPAPIAFEVPEVGGDEIGEEFRAPVLSSSESKKIEVVPQIGKMDKVTVNTVNSRKYNFHYRLEDNRLFLYGKFNQSPYEIIELNTPTDKMLYFFYDGYFYNLKKNASSITPLSRIEDKETVDKLAHLKASNSN